MSGGFDPDALELDRRRYISKMLPYLREVTRRRNTLARHIAYVESGLLDWYLLHKHRLERLSGGGPEPAHPANTL